MITLVASRSDVSYLVFPELGALAFAALTRPLISWGTAPGLLVLTPENISGQTPNNA